MKIFFFVLFAVYLGVSIYGITQMTQGLNLKLLVSDDSYYRKYKVWQDENFPFLIPVSCVFDSPIDYSDSNVQEQIQRYLQKVKSEPTVKDDLEINWLMDFKNFAGYDDSSEAAFIASLKSFLNVTTNTRFQNDVVFDDTNGVIAYSRIHVMSNSIHDSQEQGAFMTRMRELADDISLPVFVHSGLFLVFEQYNVILGQTLQTVGVAIVAVFLVTCLLMPHPAMLLLITLTIASITAGIFGFLYYINRALSSITMVEIIMSIGFSVDFSAHICHAYMVSSGGDRQERTHQAVQRSGPAIFHGAVSSILGVIILAAGTSFITITFFRVMMLVLTFAIAHALLLLPVILSLVGPPPEKPSSDIQKDSFAEHEPEQKQNGHVNHISDKYIDEDLPYEIGPPRYQLSGYTKWSKEVKRKQKDYKYTHKKPWSGHSRSTNELHHSPYSPYYIYPASAASYWPEYYYTGYGMSQNGLSADTRRTDKTSSYNPQMSWQKNRNGSWYISEAW